MLRLVLPDSPTLRPLNICFADYIATNKDKLVQDTKVEYVYGSLTDCIANGGRIVDSNTPMQVIRLIVTDYAMRGISYRFTLTSGSISAEHFNDVKLNELLSVNGTGAIVQLDSLAEYIRHNYPARKLVASVTKNADIEALYSMLNGDLYDVVVWSTRYNDTLRSIPYELRHKVEVLPLDCCPGDCPSRRRCYGYCEQFMGVTEQHNVNLAVTNVGPGLYTWHSPDLCTNAAKREAFSAANSSYNLWHVRHSYVGALGVDEIHALANDGFERIKFEGRVCPPQAILLYYVELVFKPEYQLEAYFDLLATITPGIV